MDWWKTYRSFKHINALLKIHAKVHHCPINALFQVLFLLQNKGMMIEKLLQLLIAKIDVHLLKSIELENLKSRNVQNSDENDIFHGWIHKSLVTFFHQKSENAIVKTACDTSHWLGWLVDVLTFGHPFRANLDFGLAKGFHHHIRIDSQEFSNDFSTFFVIWFALFLTSLLL